MNKETAIIMYSHSSYSDVWGLFMGQIDKYFSNDVKKYAFVDDDKGLIDNNWNIVLYDDSMSYDVRFSTCLESVKEQYCILHHEDMPLITKPNIEELQRCHGILKNEPELDYIKLIKGGEVRDIPYKEYNNLYDIPHDAQYIFAVQPTIWKTDKLKIVYNNTKTNHIREFEPKSQTTCVENSIHGAYYFNSEVDLKRGGTHYDSSIYPYVATAIVKGRWNLAEYYVEISNLAREYKVNLGDR